MANAAGETEEVERANKWTIGLAGGPLEGGLIRFAADLGVALNDGDELRVLPMVSRGSVQNVNDILYLKGVDATLLLADTFETLKKDAKTKNIEEKIQYISQVFISTWQLLARPEIKSIRDLEGKKVALPGKGVQATVLGQKVFARHGVKIQAVMTNIGAGLELLKSGEVDAFVFPGIKGSKTVLSTLENTQGLHFLSVDFAKVAGGYYVPQSLGNEDYPNLIPAGTHVETIGTPVVLAVYNWPKGIDRFRKMERFIKTYFERFERLRQPPYQPAWRDVNLGATVPGWKRYWFAGEMLAKYVAARASENATASAVALAPPPLAAQEVAAASAAPLSAEDEAAIAGMRGDEQKRLYREFIEWKQKQSAATQ